jgi:ABC-2 type transport system ATP-binding protein
METRGLSKGFGCDWAVELLDLNGANASIEGFLGPNGAGKITTIEAMLGLARPKKAGGTAPRCLPRSV